MEGNGSCGCRSAPLAEARFVPAAEAEAFKASGRGAQVAIALAVVSGSPSSLEPVEMPRPGNEVLIEFNVVNSTVSPQMTVYFLGQLEPGGTAVQFASQNVNASGHIVLSAQTGFAYPLWKVVISANSGVVIVTEVWAWMSWG